MFGCLFCFFVLLQEGPEMSVTYIHQFREIIFFCSFINAFSLLLFHISHIVSVCDIFYSH
jgi:hypothetical protein